MKHQDAAGLTLGEAARAHGDPDTIALLVAAETEAARLEAMDADPRTLANRRALLKVAAYREADYQRCQLRDALRHRLREGDLIATARERPAAPPPADVLADLRRWREDVARLLVARDGQPECGPVPAREHAGVPRPEAERAGDLLVVLLWDAMNGHARACGLPDSGTDGPIYAATDMLAWREAVNWPGLFDAEGRSVVTTRMAEDAAAEACA